jgi:hypothetical protein
MKKPVESRSMMCFSSFSAFSMKRERINEATKKEQINEETREKTEQMDGRTGK